MYEPFRAETWRDSFALYRRLRDEDPVHRSPHGFWVLSRFSDVFDAARDTETFSSAHGLSFRNDVEELSLLPTIVMMDPPDHTKYRRLVSPRFTGRRVRRIEGEIRDFVRLRLPRLAAEPTVDLVRELARPLPAYVVAQYLGVPERDRGRFDDWTVAIVQANAGGRLRSAKDALVELYGYFSDLVERRRREPGEDMISDLLASDDNLDPARILGYAFVMIAGGNDTATGLLAGVAELLTANPEQRRRLILDPSLIPCAVEEALRLTSPVQGLCRVATRDVTLRETTIRAGERVLLCYGAANRDPREFGPDAEEFDATRRIRRIVSFSSGAHYCLGAHAARLQGRVMLEELLRAHPAFTVDAAAGRFADGAFTRRYEYLPFRAGP